MGAESEPFRQEPDERALGSDIGGATEAFRASLAKNPNTPDPRRIKEYLAELDRR